MSWIESILSDTPPEDFEPVKCSKCDNPEGYMVVEQDGIFVCQLCMHSELNQARG